MSNFPHPTAHSPRKTKALTARAPPVPAASLPPLPSSAALSPSGSAAQPGVLPPPAGAGAFGLREVLCLRLQGLRTVCKDGEQGR
eukprot:360883-Chlamydomonas_euryale.AAC.3